jgi:hypothetical protein
VQFALAVTIAKVIGSVARKSCRPRDHGDDEEEEDEDDEDEIDDQPPVIREPEPNE